MAEVFAARNGGRPRSRAVATALTAGAALMLWSLIGCVSAFLQRPTDGATVPEGAVVDGPLGYVKMCGEDRALCADLISAGTSGDASLPTNFRAELKLLDAVNRQVNAAVRPAGDLQTSGQQDRWQRPVATRKGLAGDCDDVAIEKRLRLLSAGFPARDLFFAVLYRRDIGLHVVLVAHTQRGDIVLDSRSPWLTPWAATPYIWVKRQSSGDPMIWRLAIPPPAAARLPG